MSNIHSRTEHVRHRGRGETAKNPTQARHALPSLTRATQSAEERKNKIKPLQNTGPRHSNPSRLCNGSTHMSESAESHAREQTKEEIAPGMWSSTFRHDTEQEYTVVKARTQAIPIASSQPNTARSRVETLAGDSHHSIRS